MKVKGRRRSRVVAIAVLGLAGLAVPACASDAAPDDPAPSAAADEIRALARTIEERHPEPWASVPRADFHRAADELVDSLPSLSRDEAVVRVMRLVALLGARNGHTGVFPLGANPRALHLYPLQLYRFADGLFVIGELGAAQGLAGLRVVEIGGRPLAEVEELVRPTVARDNEWDLAARLPEFLVTAEVLHGVGVTPTAGSATFTLEGPSGRRTVTLEPIVAPTYTQAVGYGGRINAVPGRSPARQPRYLRLAERKHWIATVDRGRAVVAAYNQTYAAWDLAEALVRRARGKKVRRVVLDLRLNGGGDNTQYGNVLDAVRRRIARPGTRVRVLVGRHTYSAAGNLAADLDTTTRARLVGEPTGGSPSNWGDAVTVELPSLGLVAYVATSYQPFGDPRAPATRPDVSVPLTSAAYFAGRDPVLEAALR